MRHRFRLDPSARHDPRRLERRLWVHYPVDPGVMREVCEIYNNGEHLYLREYRWGLPTSVMIWLPYKDARPFIREYRCSRTDLANLKCPETLRIWVDGHMGTTSLLMFGLSLHGTRVRAEKYLAIPQGTSVRVDLRSNETRVNIQFTKFSY